MFSGASSGLDGPIHGEERGVWDSRVDCAKCLRCEKRVWGGGGKEEVCSEGKCSGGEDSL